MADFRATLDDIFGDCSQGQRGAKRHYRHVQGRLRRGFCTEFLKFWHCASETGVVVSGLCRVEISAPLPPRWFLILSRQLATATGAPASTPEDRPDRSGNSLTKITPVSGPQIVGRCSCTFCSGSLKYSAISAVICSIQRGGKRRAKTGVFSLFVLCSTP